MGLRRGKMMQMLNSTIFDCLIYKGYGQRVSERDHLPYPDAHFALELGLKVIFALHAMKRLLTMMNLSLKMMNLSLKSWILKDVSLVSSTAAMSSTPMPLCSLLKDRYLSAQAAGWNGEQFHSIFTRFSLRSFGPVATPSSSLTTASS